MTSEALRKMDQSLLLIAFGGWLAAAAIRSGVTPERVSYVCYLLAMLGMAIVLAKHVAGNRDE